MFFFQELLEKGSMIQKNRIPIVVCANENEVMKAIFKAQDENIVGSPILVERLQALEKF